MSPTLAFSLGEIKWFIFLDVGRATSLTNTLKRERMDCAVTNGTEKAVWGQM
jgi:hypothetical protein